MKYYLLTLGCPKNLVDSEAMAMLLRRQGYDATVDPLQADILIVNTCGFLQASQEEAIEALQELARQKRPKQLLIAAGCLAQRAAEEIVTRVPEVDGLLGTRRWMEITRLVEVLRGRNGHDGAISRRRRQARYQLLGDPETPLEEVWERPPAINGSAYLKISDGCNAPCSFCSIPSFKGKLRSRPFAAVVEEACALAASGAREIVLVAQDTTDYGRDRGEPDSLPRLMQAITQRAEGLRWLRLMYAYPGHVSDALIEVMASDQRIVHYLDMPLQHAHPDILRRMHRPAPEIALDHIQKLRRAIPDIALRTTFIVGFPGETEAEFQTLLDFVQAVQFDKVGVFQFSPEPGTPAARFPHQVPDEVKEERWARLMELQQRISLRRNQAQIGRVLDVLVEGYDRGISYGRSYRDAPEIDGLVLFPGRAPVGEIVQVRITGALEYDLEGVMIQEPCSGK
ncbi:MAG: 30S ribosomal protein S12 methylthiotransferase RimO [Anaerolineae bacterium]|nr:30S ribosomal protein S12 methylthiotransferase RimO [Anaerolineae bacterium]MDW8098269.1 30S ribosomal protein S12 methylthiotransferase RimO [Anaerolineae bacterium]